MDFYVTSGFYLLDRQGYSYKESCISVYLLYCIDSFLECCLSSYLESCIAVEELCYISVSLDYTKHNNLYRLVCFSSRYLVKKIYSILDIHLYRTLDI